MRTQEERVMTYADITTPDDHESVRTLLQRLDAEHQALATASERYETNAQDAESDDPVVRRQAQRRRAELRDAVEDAQLAPAKTRRELDATRRAIRADVAPIIEAERQRHLPRVRAALIELEAAAIALRAVESTAGTFGLSSSFGDFILVETQRLRTALQQHEG